MNDMGRRISFLSRSAWVGVFLLITLLISGGCRPAVEVAADPESPPATATLPEPTNTPLPPSELLVLVAAAETEASQVQAVEALLAETAASNGMEFETLSALSAAEVTPELKLAVYLSPPPNLMDVVRAAPQTQFIAVSQVDLEAAPNLSVIRHRPEQAAFIAGAAAVVIAFDWRSAGLLPADSLLGAAHEDLFRNGGGYFCGICNPFYAPHVRFPLTAALPLGSDFNAWRQAVDELLLKVVYVIYIAPEVASPELLTYLAVEKNLILLGGQSPPDEVRPRWAATITSDILTPLQELLPTLLAGEGGKVLPANLIFTDVQPALFSPGRQMLVEQIRDDLREGWIEPYSVPLQ